MVGLVFFLLLYICAKIKCNVSKSQIIVLNHNKSSQNNTDIHVNNQKIVSEVKHLGHVLCNKNTDIINVEYIGKCFSKSVNIIKLPNRVFLCFK